MENLYKTRFIAENKGPTKKGESEILKYNEKDESLWLDIKERRAWQAVASLAALKKVWRDNRNNAAVAELEHIARISVNTQISKDIGELVGNSI